MGNDAITTTEFESAPGPVGDRLAQSSEELRRASPPSWLIDGIVQHGHRRKPLWRRNGANQPLSTCGHAFSAYRPLGDHPGGAQGVAEPVAKRLRTPWRRQRIERMMRSTDTLFGTSPCNTAAACQVRYHCVACSISGVASACGMVARKLGS